MGQDDAAAKRLTASPLKILSRSICGGPDSDRVTRDHAAGILAAGVARTGKRGHGDQDDERLHL
jgi:hypothetical protein